MTRRYTSIIYLTFDFLNMTALEKTYRKTFCITNVNMTRKDCTWYYKPNYSRKVIVM